MRRGVCVLGVFLAGCPYIPGKWSDYAGPPAETQLLGIVEFYEPQGGYWQDDSAFGTALAGWLEVPEAGRSWMPEVGCVQRYPEESVYNVDGLADAGDSPLEFVGPDGNIEADWLPDSTLWYGDFTSGSYTPEASYDLGATTVAGKVIKASNVFTFPTPLVFDGPEIDGAELGTIALDDLSWSWSGGRAGERVWAQVTLRDADLEALETVFCAVDAADGQIEVPTGEFNEAKDAVYATIFVEVLREGGAKLGDSVGGARFVAGHGVLGYVKVE